jgi:hypothetical protein
MKGRLFLLGLALFAIVHAIYGCAVTPARVSIERPVLCAPDGYVEEPTGARFALECLNR